MNLIDQVKRDHPGADTRTRNRVYAAMLYHAFKPDGDFEKLADEKQARWIAKAERQLEAS